MPEEAREVRRFLRSLLADCPFLDDVLLGVDELAVNTIRHTRSGRPGGRFVVEVRRCHGVLGEAGVRGEKVVVWVRDEGGPREPAIPPGGDGFAENGRGLLTLSRTAESWGWFGDAHGRTVCAVFAEPGASGEHAADARGSEAHRAQRG
nr:ATP-binding protein [Actinocorallia populi]